MGEWDSYPTLARYIALFVENSLNLQAINLVPWRKIFFDQTSMFNDHSFDCISMQNSIKLRLRFLSVRFNWRNARFKKKM